MSTKFVELLVIATKEGGVCVGGGGGIKEIPQSLLCSVRGRGKEVLEWNPEI